MLPASIWYRMVAGLNAQLRTVRQGCLRRGLAPLLTWIGTHANPWLRLHGLRIDLAWFQVRRRVTFQAPFLAICCRTPF